MGLKGIEIYRDDSACEIHVPIALIHLINRMNFKLEIDTPAYLRFEQNR